MFFRFNQYFSTGIFKCAIVVQVSILNEIQVLRFSRILEKNLVYQNMFNKC